MSATLIRRAAAAEYDQIGQILEDAYTHSFSITPSYRDSLHQIAEFAQVYDIWVATTSSAVAPGGRVGDPESDGADMADRIVGVVLTPTVGYIPPNPPDERGVPQDAHPEEFMFRLLAVCPSARGQGIAKALVNHTIALARQRGFAKIGINSGPQMTDAHRLYEAMGFVRIPERETRVVDGGQRLLFYSYDIPA